ncbi:hypothetical protein MANES_12G047100v8 [Manihot esculenta]|uniref:Uncharacterized protein n=2 Tax=Manihot esculenta TaxID=3983 RepID=A0ACB7GPT2_MANES|nr:hypothetical protein MANES_12G047100v8 [Manihot esculenta]
MLGSRLRYVDSAFLGEGQPVARERQMDLEEQRKQPQEEEELEVGLRGRPSRRPSGQKTPTFTTTAPSSGVYSSSQRQELEPENGIFFNKVEGTESINGFSDDSKDVNDDVAPISESTSLLAESSLPVSDNGTGYESTTVRKESRQELYLDEVYKKPVTHEFYCPHCHSCITKVVIREIDSAHRVGLLRCTSCFSFLTLAGEWLLSNFAPKGEGVGKQDPAETNVPQDLPDDSLIQTTSVVDSPATQIVSSPAEMVKQNQNLGFSLDEKHSQKEPEPDERPEIQADIKGKLTTQKTDEAAVETIPSTAIIIFDDGQTQARDETKLEILKSIVYGGLMESITSLGVVTSAASADAATLNILALALANLVSGLFIIGHNLRELKNEQPGGVPSDQTNEREERYEELLGKRQNFILHATIVLLSFIVFGLVPPVVYGFSFHKSDNKDYKLAAVAAASLLCITLLAIGKAYVQKPPKNYLITVLKYAVIGVMASGVSYVAGDLVKKIIEKSGFFQSDVAVTAPLAGMKSDTLEWASY